jgi:hypothetical protein
MQAASVLGLRRLSIWAAAVPDFILWSSTEQLLALTLLATPT